MLRENGDDDEWLMPELTDSEEDRKALIEQQKGDKTLASVRAWAERGQGYGFQDGIIVHSQESEHGEEWKCVVVPIERRREISKLSHSSTYDGRALLSEKNRRHTKERRKVFTWPCRSGTIC